MNYDCVHYKKKILYLSVLCGSANELKIGRMPHNLRSIDINR